MSQIRNHEFQDIDSTFELNAKFLPFVRPGVYWGFDFAPAAGMFLQLTSASGAVFYAKDGTPETYSVALTKQGVSVRQKDFAGLPINPNPASQGRWDAVVMEHNYQDIDGGAEALFVTVEGLAGGGKPVAGENYNQLLIGYLFLPAGCTSLNAAGVLWQKSSTPFFAGSDPYSSLIALKANKQQEEWKFIPAFTYPTVPASDKGEYMKDTFGFVHLRGSLFWETVTEDDEGRVTFRFVSDYRLPAGYHPQKEETFWTFLRKAATNILVGYQLTITAAGGITVTDILPTQGPGEDPANYTPLGGISFYAGLV